MKLINLTRGVMAQVDDEDFDHLVAMGRWCAIIQLRTSYARRVVCGAQIYMHRFIMNMPTKGIDVDHIDGNGLNNQKHNLRLANRFQNIANSTRRFATTTGYRGVYHSSPPCKFTARIKVGSGYRALGRFSSAEDAARAFDVAAIEKYGQFARLNFPGEQK